MPIKQAHVSRKHLTRQSIAVGKQFRKGSYFITAKLCYKKKRRYASITVVIHVSVFVLLSYAVVTPASRNILQLESPNCFKKRHQ